MIGRSALGRTTEAEERLLCAQTGIVEIASIIDFMRNYQLLIVAAVVLLDRITKLLVIGQLPVAHQVPIIPGLFQLAHWENTGAAFSMFADSAATWRTPGLIAFSVLACVVITYLLWKHRAVLNVTSVSLCLILGGALGNLWDRLRKGTVTDFLDFYIGQHHWPPFNVADSAIVVGALLLIITILFSRKPNLDSKPSAT